MNKLIAVAITTGSISLAACGNTIPHSEAVTGQVTLTSSHLERYSSGKDLHNKYWNSGKEICSSRLVKESVVSNYEVHQYDDASFIIRQHKCSSFESPFMYLMLGEEKNVLVDSGAKTADNGKELAALVSSLVAKYGQSPSLMVVHSHHHSDHTAGDSAFSALENTHVVSADTDAFLKFMPKDELTLDLGGRSLTLMKTPGHQEESVSIYDTGTQWLLTGDSFYPGLIYVKDWQAYQASIARLVAFTKQNPISYVLGAHVEMSNVDGIAYEVGSLYQPEEASIAMTVDQLEKLNMQLEGKQENTLLGGAYIVQPMNGLQKSLSNLVRWARK